MNPRIRLLDALLVPGMMIISCNNFRPNDETEILVPTTELTKDSMEAAFYQTLDEIDRNLEMIRQKEGMIVLNDSEGKFRIGPNKDRILQNIQMINSLLDDNNQKIAHLESLLNKSKDNNAALKALKSERHESVAALKKQIEELKHQLAQRDFGVEELNIRIRNLEMERDQLHQKVQELDKKAYTAYYAVGTWKELKGQGLVKKTGGVLGLGRSHRLNADFKNAYFSSIDSRETTDIALFSKKAQILTNHPADAYELIEEDNKVTFLRITDAEAFWKTSKHLVVEIKI